MLLVAIAWLYVVLMVAVVEATSRQGTLLGALLTFVLWGLLPLGLLSYLFFSPARRRARRAADAAAGTAGRSGDAAASAPASGAVDPDQRGHAAGDAVAAERKEP